MLCSNFEETRKSLSSGGIRVGPPKQWWDEVGTQKQWWDEVGTPKQWWDEGGTPKQWWDEGGTPTKILLQIEEGRLFHTEGPMMANAWCWAKVVI